MDESDIITIDKKSGIVLGKAKSTGAFYIWFELSNPSVELPGIVDTAMFDMVAGLNPDILERVETLNKTSADSFDTLYVLKRFGAELGIPQKYMYIRTTVNRQPGKITISGRSDWCPVTLPAGASPIHDCVSEMVFSWADPHKVQVSYMFKATVHERLPIYMENIMGLLTKKMFLRVKTFIENM
jgi:hypothetical protein